MYVYINTLITCASSWCFFLHMNIVCVTALGPISLIRFYAPFAVWFAYCLLLNVEWIAIQNFVGLCIYSCSCLMFHTAIKLFWFWFDLIDMISVTHDILRRTDCILYRGPLPFTRGRKMHKKTGTSGPWNYFFFGIRFWPVTGSMCSFAHRHEVINLEL